MSSTSERNIASNKVRDSNTTKKIHLARSTDTKPLKKHQSGYSEKRGLSTIYIPKSNLTGNSSKGKKETVKEVTNKTMSNNSVSKSKSDPQSKIRRNSRTLSSEEVKVLHSLMRKDNSKREVPKKKEVITKQKGTDQNKHDDDYYADDFEV